MGILRISIFQKNLNERLNPSTLKELSRLKSDFLLLPEYFYADTSVTDHRTLLDAQERARNWLLNLSKSYKGSIIGGTLVYDKEEGSRIGIPIIRNAQIVDWYDKHKLDSTEKKIASAGSGEGIFILGGVRFAAVIYKDITQKGFWEKLAKEEIKLLFVLASFEGPAPHKEIKEKLLPIAKKYATNIVLCCAVGKSFQFPKALAGCSAVLTPYGLSWQISPEEENKQFLKTVMLNYTLPIGQEA